MSIRRSADSVYLQYIWNAIEACSRDSVGATFHEILSFIQKEYDSKITANKLQSELSYALTDKCINYQNCCYVKCEFLPVLSKDSHDCYCFECHGPGYVVACPTCFRVYHPDCLSVAAETQLSFYLPYESSVTDDKASQRGSPPNEPCAVCQRLSHASKSIDSSEMHKIFMVTLDWIRNKVNWKTMQVVGYLNESLRNNYFVYRQINTRVIAERMRANPASKDGYPNRTSLLIDLDNLVHNTSVFYGTKNDMSNMARQIRFQIKNELLESTYCVDCFLRSPSSTSTTRLTAPCRVPHRLFWFQHNGWSFRPCKLLYEKADGYEVICFGGRHERVFVPLARAVDMSFTAMDLGLRMTPPLKKALDEAEEYKANQAVYTNGSKTTLSSDTLKVSVEKMHMTDWASFQTDKGDATMSKNATPSLLRKRKSGHLPPKKPEKLSESSRGQNSKRRKSVEPKNSDENSGLWENNSRDSEGNLTSFSSLESDADSNVSTSKSLASKFSSKASVVNNSPNVNSVQSTTDVVKQYRPYNKVNQLECGLNDDNSSSHDDGTDYSSLNSSSSTCNGNNSSPFRCSTLPTPKTQQTIRIKPLPIRSESTMDLHTNSDSKCVLARAERLDDHRGRMKPVLSNSSSSSAVSCPSSGHTTLPALAPDDHIPTDSSNSSLAESRTSSFASAGSKSRRNRCRKSSNSVKLYNDSESVPKTDIPKSSFSTRLVISRIGRKHSENHESNSIPSVTNTNSRSNFTLNKQVNNRSNSPSSLSDAESDSSVSSSTSLSSSSSATSSITSQMSSSSLSANMNLASKQRLSFFALNSAAATTISTTTTTTTTTTETKATIPKSKHNLAKSQLQPIVDRKQLTTDVKSVNDKSDDSLPKLTKSTKTNRRSCLRSEANLSRGPSISSSSPKRCEINHENTNNNVLEQMARLPQRISCNTDATSNSREVSYSSAPNSTTKASYTSHRVSSFEHSNSRTNSMTTIYNTNQSKAPTSNYHDHTSVTLCGSHPTGSLGPTPPSNSSASSSCYSSVSPAALSSTSGLGSSMSDQKSVDASPGEVVTSLGTALGGISQNSHSHSDVTMMKTEDRIHRIYADRLIALTSERDQAREEVHRRDALIAELKRAHEAELIRVKQRTWCQVCLNEAFYHCCPGTAYCSDTCQLRHWTSQHNRDCLRRSESENYQQSRA